jgi:hypothetical protein
LEFRKLVRVYPPTTRHVDAIQDRIGGYLLGPRGRKPKIQIEPTSKPYKFETLVKIFGLGKLNNFVYELGPPIS